MDKTLIEKLDDILAEDSRDNCLCAWYESCEVCASRSSYNQLRKKMREALHGPDPLPDYSQTLTIELEEDELAGVAASMGLQARHVIDDIIQKINGDKNVR